MAFAARGVRAMAIRLPQVHGGDGHCGLIEFFLPIAREKGVCAYIGEGGNRWAAAHRLDVARLYRLALEKGIAGTSYHAVADEGVPHRDIAKVLARHLDLPTASISPEEAAAISAGSPCSSTSTRPASSALTQKWLGWKPREIGLSPTSASRITSLPETATATVAGATPPPPPAPRHRRAAACPRLAGGS
ncbi:MAG: 3-beta hydroxysteroid dehydrogenase [Bauldia sp.]